MINEIHFNFKRQTINLLQRVEMYLSIRKLSPSFILYFCFKKFSEKRKKKKKKRKNKVA